MLATPFSLCSNVAPRSHPGARRLTPPFRLRRNRASDHRPRLLGLPRKIRRGISLRETTLCGCPLRSHDFVTPHRCFSLPRFRSAQSQPHGPSQHPGACRHSAPFRCAKPRWPVVAPAGGNVLATPFSLRSNVAPRSHPGACRRSAPFRCAKPRWPVVAPAGGNVLATPFSLRSNVAPHIPAGSAGVRSFVPRLAPRSHPGACRHSAPFRCAKPRVRLPAPPFGFAAQNQARHFAARNHPGRLSASRPWLRHPAPLFCRSRHACAAPGPQRQNPGACSHSVAFHSAKPRGRLPAPPFGFAAQNRARHFAARNHPGRPSASRPWLRRPAPSFSPPRRSRAHNGIRLLFSDKYEQKA